MFWARGGKTILHYILDVPAKQVLPSHFNLKPKSFIYLGKWAHQWLLLILVLL